MAEEDSTSPGGRGLGAVVVPSMASLADVMRVFACGLIPVLISAGGILVSPTFDGGRPIQKGREIPDVRKGLKTGLGDGYESVGPVYRDPDTGRLFLLEGDSD